MRTRPLHSNGTEATSRRHYLVQRQPLLRAGFGPLLRGAVRPQLRPKRLCVRHVVRAVRVRPEVAVPAHALWGRDRDVGPARTREPRGVLRGRELVILCDESPVVILQVAAVGDRQTGRARAREGRRDRIMVVVMIVAVLRHALVHPPRPRFRATSVDLDDLRALVERVGRGVARREPFAMELAPMFIVYLKNSPKQTVKPEIDQSFPFGPKIRHKFILTLGFRALISSWYRYSLLIERRALWDRTAAWARNRACML